MSPLTLCWSRDPVMQYRVLCLLWLNSKAWQVFIYSRKHRKIQKDALESLKVHLDKHLHKTCKCLIGPITKNLQQNFYQVCLKHSYCLSWKEIKRLKNYTLYTLESNQLIPFLSRITLIISPTWNTSIMQHISSNTQNTKVQDVNILHNN